MPLIGKSVTLSIVALCAAFYAAPAAAQKSRAPKLDQIRIAHEKPSNPAHQDLYDLIRERRALERIKEFLSPLRLPRRLLLRIAGCDGAANAWYDRADTTITVCYEYIDEVRRHAPTETTAQGITPDDAVAGPFVEVFLHEVAHALFDMLRIPILGREEDAADQIAAYLLLQLGKDEARRVIGGIALMYFREAREQSTAMAAFASRHGLPAQRFYNVLCLTYGSDPGAFADIVEKRYLPQQRADGCVAEYKQVAEAFHRLIRPHLDPVLARRVKRRKWLRPQQAATP
jgi:Putative metallopeptidase